MNIQPDTSPEFDRFYSERSSSGINAVKVGWKDKQAQWKRFVQLTKLIDRDVMSVNDLGCGLGDYFNFLNSNGYKGFEYYGYDVIPSMTAEALRLNVEPNAHFMHIQSPDEMNTADYTVASGIFNLRFAKSDSDWLNYIQNTVRIMFSKSVKGVAFNCLTSYSDKEYMKQELYYTDPCAMFDFCKRNLSKNVALLHDYGEYDFTMIVRK